MLLKIVFLPPSARMTSSEYLSPIGASSNKRTTVFSLLSVTSHTFCVLSYVPDPEKIWIVSVFVFASAGLSSTLIQIGPFSNFVFPKLAFASSDRCGSSTMSSIAPLNETATSAIAPATVARDALALSTASVAADTAPSTADLALSTAPATALFALSTAPATALFALSTALLTVLFALSMAPDTAPVTELVIFFAAAATSTLGTSTLGTSTLGTSTLTFNPNPIYFSYAAD